MFRSRSVQGATISIVAAVFLVVTACLAAHESSHGAQSPSQVSAGNAPPVITKIEPPNWWTGITPRVMLLISGRNLTGATISCKYRGFIVSHAKVSDGGRYLFAWMRIHSTSLPGTVPCAVRTPAGAAAMQFPLASRPSSIGKFQGLTESDAIYLIMVDRFADGDTANDHLASMPGTFSRSNPRAYHGGDLRGIREHLGYLRSLGVTTLWLTPIVANDSHSPQDYHGYGAVDEYAVNPHFGTLGDLQQLVAAAHRDGMKVLLDYVVNHVGPRNPWAAAPPEPDWFNGTLAHHTEATSDFQYLTDPHAPPSLWRNVVDGWFANMLPDLNQNDPDVARYFIQNATWWAEETGIDGYRLDTFPYVPRRFWSEFHAALHRLFPHFFTVGEVFNFDPVVTSFFDGGRAQFDGVDTGVTSVFDYPFYFTLRSVVLNGAPPSQMVRVLARDSLYARPQLLVPFLGNHDVPRLASMPASSEKKLRLAYGILLTMRGIPELYYGDEIGMSGGGDPDNRHDFPGGFPGDSRDAFRAAERTPQQQRTFSYVQQLLRLRREHAALSGGSLWSLAWDQSSYAYARVAGNERLLVVFNASGAGHSLHFSVADTPVARSIRIVPLFGTGTATLRADTVEITLPGEGLGIWKLE